MGAALIRRAGATVFLDDLGGGEDDDCAASAVFHVAVNVRARGCCRRWSMTCPWCRAQDRTFSFRAESIDDAIAWIAALRCATVAVAVCMRVRRAHSAHIARVRRTRRRVAPNAPVATLPPM